MKQIINALVAAGFNCPADADENTVLTHVSALISDRTKIKAENEKHVAAQTSRVSVIVAKAIDEKIVSESRKDALLRLGANDESELIAQVEDLRKLAASAPKSPRGAKPAQINGQSEPSENESRIEEIQAELRKPGLSAIDRANLTAESLKLRGLDNLFAPKPASN